MRTTLGLLLVAGLLASSAALAGSGDKSKTGMGKSGTATGTAQKGDLTEAQALGVMLTANAGEVAIGQAVAARTSNADVRTYATKLMDDHMASNKDLLKLAENTKMVPADSPVRGQLTDDVNKELADVWAKDTAELDKMFLTAAIEDHAKDLKMIDEKLMTSVTTPELKQQLTTWRATIAGHLDDACRLGTPMGISSADCGQRGTE